MSRLVIRSRKIAEVLVRNGFSALVVESGLDHRLPQSMQVKLGRNVGNQEVEPRPEMLVSALQELGTTAVKLGQTLAMRRDVLPPAYCDALETLTDGVEPLPAEQMKQIIEETLGGELGEYFSDFENHPLGAASVGQVHAATTVDGRQVVVKVRKPGVRDDVESDLVLLNRMVRELTKRNRRARESGLADVVAQFSKTMTAELDFSLEAESCRIMAELFADDPSVHIPWIDSELSSASILTQERVGGIKLDDAEQLRDAGLDPAQVGEQYASALMRMVFEFGIFHADPHAGNVFVEPDGRIVFIDWGMTGRLSEQMRDHLILLLIAFSANQRELLISVLLEIAPPRQHVDRVALTQDLGELLDHIQDSSLRDIQVSEVAERALGLVRKHRLALPADAVNLIRVLAIGEGIVRQLSPSVSVIDVAQRQAKASFTHQLKPEQLKSRLRKHLSESIVFAYDMPARLNRIFERVENGELEVNVRGDVMDASMAKLTRLTNRLVGGMLTSAGVVAAALIYTAHRGRENRGG